MIGRSIPRQSFWILLAFFAGCAGYTLGPTPPTFMRGVHRVAIPIFKNATIASDIQAMATTTVIKQIQQDGTYEVTGVDQADRRVKARHGAALQPRGALG